MVLFTHPAGSWMLLQRAEPRNCRLPLAAEPLFQTTSSAVSQSGYRTPLLVLDIADVWKRKSIILSPLSVSFIHRLSVSISRACYPTHLKLCKWKMSRRDHLAEPCLVRGKSPWSASMRHSVPLWYHRRYTGMHGADSGAGPPALLTQGNLHQVNQFHRCEKSKTDSKPGLGCKQFSLGGLSCAERSG